MAAGAEWRKWHLLQMRRAKRSVASGIKWRGVKICKTGETGVFRQRLTGDGVNRGERQRSGV
jgi:hypothetical protein